MLNTKFATCSFAGLRQQMQDVFNVISRPDDHHVFILADGLGGHRGGRIAATIAVDTLSKYLNGGIPDRHEFCRYVQEANAEISLAQSRENELQSMRSTLVLLHVDADSAYWLHCGDSRLYHLRGKDILSVTKDHSVAQMLVATGELDAAGLRSHPDRHKLHRSLGGTSSEARVRVVKPVRLQPGDSFLLCTDGWWEQLPDSLIVACQADDPAEWLANMQREINRSTTAVTDNYTAIAVTV